MRTYDDAPTRYEMNRLVLSVLTRHRVDLELISISCMARIVYMHGSLVKTTKPGYKSADIDLIIQDIEQIPLVRGIVVELENWTVSSSTATGTRLIVPKRSLSRPGGGAAFDQTEYRIEDVDGKIRENPESENLEKK